MLIFVFACVLGCTLAQTRPVIPNDFYSEVVVNYHTHGSLLFGMGRWAIDQTQNMGLEDYKYYDVLGHSTYVWQLQRYDMNETYSVIGGNKKNCSALPVSGSMPSQWDWVENATYNGTLLYHDVELDMWKLQISPTQVLTVGVLPPEYNVPIVFNNEDGAEKLYVEFFKFEPGTTFNHALFSVPSYCPTNGSFSLNV